MLMCLGMQAAITGGNGTKAGFADLVNPVVFGMAIV